MQERILIAPNGTELMRMLAKNGVSTLGLRIMQPAELARFALMRSGITLAETQLNPEMEAALIYRFLPKIPYFRDASYHDAQNISRALRMLRSQITDNEQNAIRTGLSSSPFTEKNAAICAVYEAYIAAIQHEKALDQISLIRKAIADAKPLTAEIMTMREYPLTLLDAALAEHLSGGAYQTVSLCGLLHAAAKPFAMPPITEVYGAANEVESVIGTIYQQNMPLDQCLLALTDASVYAPLLFELTSRFGIPATFGCGLPITLSQPASVLQDYLQWRTAGHCGADALKALICNSGFDTKQFCKDFGIADRSRLTLFLKTAGNLRLSDHADTNRQRISAYQASAARDEDLISQLTNLFVEMGMNCVELIRRYGKIRQNDLGRLDKAAQNKICGTMEHFCAMTGDSPITLIPDLLQTRICAETSCAGALHITDLSGALPALRQNLFVLGLSAELFPGVPAENYLLLDDELSAFGESAPTSLNRIRQTQDLLHDLLNTTNALGIRTALSYSGYDTAELKENNASSVLFSLYQLAGGSDEEAFKKTIQKAGYFSQILSGVSVIGNAYLRGEKTAPHLPKCDESPAVTGIIPPISPSKAEVFLECPKKYCYQNVMHIPEHETDSVFEIINAKEFGNLVHEAMQFLYERLPDEAAFLANADRIFARFLTERPPMNRKDAEKEKEDYTHTVRNGFYRAADMHIAASEQNVEMQYDCGITVRGRLDALAELPDGTFRVIDYKTGHTLKHEKNDAGSCIQVMLYADMLQKCGKQVSGGEYWYLRLDKVIPCDFTPERAELIETKLSEIAEAIRTNSYPANASKANCQYCPYKEICAEGGAVS